MSFTATSYKRSRIALPCSVGPRGRPRRRLRFSMNTFIHITMTRLAQLWAFEGHLPRSRYVAAGIGLFLVKYGVDLLVATKFQQPWSPLMYLSPRVSPLLTADPTGAYWLILLVVALP